MTSPPLLDRARGCLLGLAVGDAIGTTVEFARRGSFEPLVDMIGGGPFDLAPGAAVAGQIAGAHYGESGIPAEWTGRLHLADFIRELADDLFEIRD